MEKTKNVKDKKIWYKKWWIYMVFVAIFIGTFCIAIFYDNTNISTMVAGWISGVATIVLGGIAILQNKSYKNENKINDKKRKEEIDKFNYNQKEMLREISNATISLSFIFNELFKPQIKTEIVDILNESNTREELKKKLIDKDIVLIANYQDKVGLKNEPTFELDEAVAKFFKKRVFVIEITNVGEKNIEEFFIWTPLGENFNSKKYHMTFRECSLKCNDKIYMFFIQDISDSEFNYIIHGYCENHLKIRYDLQLKFSHSKLGIMNVYCDKIKINKSKLVEGKKWIN